MQSTLFKNRPLRSVVGACSLLATLALTFSSQADERRFAYVYEATTMTKGQWEYEQWVTWKNYGDKDVFDVRHEIEYGVTDNFQLALYLADWRHTNYDDGDSKTQYKNTAVEAIYNFTDPIQDFIGSGIYGEVKVGDQKFVLESKLLLQKDWGPISLAYNFKAEAEWEGDSLSNLDEQKGEFGNYLGLSYQVSPSFLFGAEAVHEWEYADWSDRSGDAVYVGPNVSWRKGSFFATTAALWQVTNEGGAPDNQLRLLLGWLF